MDSCISNSSSHPVKTKLTLSDWFERSRKQRAVCEALNDDSSEGPVGCSHWSGEPDELTVEMPLAKRVRHDHGDDCIAIDADSDNEDEPDSTFSTAQLSDSPTDATMSNNDVCHSAPLTEIDTPTMLSTSINTDFRVSRQSSVKNSAQMVNPPEDIAAVATSSPIQPTNIKYPVTLYSNKPRSFNPTWFKLYSWLEYSVKQDACFCFPCRMQVKLDNLWIT